MPLVTTRAGASSFGLGWGAAAGEELGGMVLLTPTSIAYTGGGSETATIGANGSVEFTAVTSLSLNGVFDATYDNYMIMCRLHNDGTAGQVDFSFRMRASGTDETTTSYTRQRLEADGSSVNGARATGLTFGRIGDNLVSSAQRDGFSLYLYGPHLAQPTAARSVTVSGFLNARISDAVSTHSVSSTYDGITFFLSSYSFAGLVSVYGLVGS